MTTFGAELQVVARDMLNEFGRSATFVVTTGGSFDPETSLVTGTTSSNVTVKGTPPGSEGLKFLGFEVSRYPYADNLPEGSTFFYIAVLGLTFTPKRGQQFSVDGVTYQVESIDVVWGGEEKVLYGILGKS